jgi:chromosome partitioning protein
VDILPATIDLAAAEVELINATLRELVLKDVLAKLRPRYDHILVDCPPSLGLLTINALAAADRVIIPTQCEFLAIRGLALLQRTLNKVQARLNRDLRIAGILPTMYDGRTTHAREVLHELQTHFPGLVFDVVIKHTVRMKESPAAGLSILDYDHKHEVAQAYLKLAMEVDHG